MEAAKNAIVENQEIMATETAKLHKLEADLVREQENLEKVMESLKGTLSSPSYILDVLTGISRQDQALPGPNRDEAARTSTVGGQDQ